MNRTILIADDDFGYRSPLVEMFEDFGFTVYEAIDKDQVRDFASHSAVWIVDVRLPTVQQEGIEIVQELVERGVKPAYPVVFISALPKTFQDTENKLLKLDFEYVWKEKPFELEDVLRTVQGFMGSSQ